jgi:hypothetical protein
MQQWKHQISSVEHRIAKAEEAASIEETQAEESINESIQALLEKLEQIRTASRTALTLQTNPMRDQIRKIEEKLKSKAACLLDTRRLPPEILVEIFKCVFEECLPRRGVGLVCKRWRELILDTPCLWRYISVRRIEQNGLATYCATIQRRVQLSRSTLLDVTLDLRDWEDFLGEGRDDSDEAIRMITRSGIERWRSLQIIDKFEDSFSYDGMFDGSFTALRRLGFRGDVGEIQRFINGKIPLLQEVDFRVSKILFDPSNCSGILKLTTHLVAIPQFGSLTSLKELHVVPQPSSFDSFRRSKDQLEANVELPSLSYLSVTRLSAIRHLIAPNLKVLLITSTEDTSQKEIAEMMAIFLKQPKLIVMKPSSIDFACVPGTVELTIAALRHWPQLQHIKLAFYGLSWQDVLQNGFMDQENLICPELIHLRMDLRGHRDGSWEIDSDFESDDVNALTEFPEEMAQKMLEVRKKTPLRIVEWRSYHFERDPEWHLHFEKDSEWHMLKRSEQGIQHYAVWPV